SNCGMRPLPSGGRPRRVRQISKSRLPSGLSRSEVFSTNDGDRRGPQGDADGFALRPSLLCVPIRTYRRSRPLDVRCSNKARPWTVTSSWRSHRVGTQPLPAWLPQIVVHDIAEAERKVSKDVDRGHDLDDRQLGDGCQSMRRQVQAVGPGPLAFYSDILKMKFDEFADARCAVDMRNDLEEKVRRCKRGTCLCLARPPPNIGDPDGLRDDGRHHRGHPAVPAGALRGLVPGQGAGLCSERKSRKYDCPRITSRSVS